jgi:hypothetical protein
LDPELNMYVTKMYGNMSIKFINIKDNYLSDVLSIGKVFKQVDP